MTNIRNWDNEPQLSDCCKAPVRSAHGCDADLGHGEKTCDCTMYTAWNECTACNQPCDVFVHPWSEEAKDKRAFDIFTESMEKNKADVFVEEKGDGIWISDGGGTIFSTTEHTRTAAVPIRTKQEEWEDKLSNFLQDWDITVEDPFFEKAIWELFRSSIQQARKEAREEVLGEIEKGLRLAEQKCPQCSVSDAGAESFDDGEIFYTCNNCTRCFYGTIIARQWRDLLTKLKQL